MAQFQAQIRTAKQFAAITKDARIAKGLTQEELAQLTGFSRPWINQFEQGKIDDPGMSRILTLCEALDITLALGYLPEDTAPSQSKTKSPIIPDTTKAATILEALTQRALSTRTERLQLKEKTR